jgi:hypothetical protein
MKKSHQSNITSHKNKSNDKESRNGTSSKKFAHEPEIDANIEMRIK